MHFWLYSSKKTHDNNNNDTRQPQYCVYTADSGSRSWSWMACRSRAALISCNMHPRRTQTVCSTGHDQTQRCVKEKEKKKKKKIALCMKPKLETRCLTKCAGDGASLRVRMCSRPKLCCIKQMQHCRRRWWLGVDILACTGGILLVSVHMSKARPTSKAFICRLSMDSLSASCCSCRHRHTIATLGPSAW